MARTVTGLVSSAVTFTVLVRYVLASTNPGHRPPGPGRPDPDPRCPRADCGRIAKRDDTTSLYHCDSCRSWFGVAVCVKCRGFAYTDDDYAWVCGGSHTTYETRKCPCGRLGDPIGRGWWRCGFPDCVPFAIRVCQCGFSGADHGYACIRAGDTNWSCELTGTNWSSRS